MNSFKKRKLFHGELWEPVLSDLKEPLLSDYKKYIAQPMDLKTVKERLDEGERLCACMYMCVSVCFRERGSLLRRLQRMPKPRIYPCNPWDDSHAMHIA